MSAEVYNNPITPPDSKLIHSLGAISYANETPVDALAPILEKLGDFGELTYSLSSLPGFTIKCHDAIYKDVESRHATSMLPKGLVLNHIKDYYRNPAIHPGSSQSVHQRVLLTKFDKFSLVANRNVDKYEEIRLVNKLYETTVERDLPIATAGVEALLVAYGMTFESFTATRIAVKSILARRLAEKSNWAVKIVPPRSYGA